MRHPFRHAHHINRHIHRGMRRPFRRGGRLLGLVGLVALGYTLLEKNRREQARQDVFVRDGYPQQD